MASARRTPSSGTRPSSTYRQALQGAPDKPEYKIALERAMQEAAGTHVARARALEAAGQPDEALREYRKASEFDPSNRSIAARAAELDRELRERLEAARPRPPIEAMREQARKNSQEPALNPTSKEPLNLRFSNTSLRDLLNFIGSSTGINVTYDRDFQDRSITVQLEGVTLNEALQQMMLSNQIFYKVLNERTIIIATDNTAKRQQYEEQVIKTFFISHADATELAQLVNTVILAPQMAIQPRIAANKTANTITVRAAAPVAEIIEQVIRINDKPRAEVIIDVQILEVSRERAKRFGLNLTDYALGGIFSPEQAPGGSSTTATGGTTTTGGATAPSNVGSPPVFNANTISTGISAADFYLAVPAAIVRFLESDSQTKTVAKPQLRGTEGQKVTLNLGEEVPVPSTTFTPLAQGGAAANPLTSFTYRPIGVIVEMTPRVTYEGEIVMDLVLENSARGQDSTIAGQTLPAFASRKVTTRLRLRDGESNLLAGLLREDERRSLRGFPGILRLPLLQQLFADNDTNIRQTDIVMLLTPRIVRSHQLTTKDLSPIYIGTQANMAVGGPPPVFGGGNDAPAAATPPVAPPVAPQIPAGTPMTVPGSSGTPQIPPGSSPIPGTTTSLFGTPIPQPAPAPSGITSFPSPEAIAAAATPAPTTPAPPVAGGTPPATPQPAPTARPDNPLTGASSAPAPAIVLVSPPTTDLRVGGGPYLVPVSISGASRLSTVSLSLNFNPAVMRVRTVQEGSLLQQGGVKATFTQKVDAAGGRVDIAVVRGADVLGASGTGVVAAIMFDAVAPGTSPLAVSGVGTLAGGGAAALQFQPVTVTVK